MCWVSRAQPNLQEICDRAVISLREGRKIVKAATPEQRHDLGELTGSGFGSDPDTLCNHIRYFRAGSARSPYFY